jgi:hypothetical protein
MSAKVVFVVAVLATLLAPDVVEAGKAQRSYAEAPLKETARASMAAGVTTATHGAPRRSSFAGTAGTRAAPATDTNSTARLGLAGMSWPS